MATVFRGEAGNSHAFSELIEQYLTTGIIPGGVFQEPNIEDMRLFDFRHAVWDHPMGKRELEKAHRDLCQEFWSLRNTLARVSHAFFLGDTPESLLQRFL